LNEPELPASDRFLSWPCSPLALLPARRPTMDWRANRLLLGLSLVSRDLPTPYFLLCHYASTSSPWPMGSLLESRSPALQPRRCGMYSASVSCWESRPIAAARSPWRVLLALNHHFTNKEGRKGSPSACEASQLAGDRHRARQRSPYSGVILGLRVLAAPLALSNRHHPPT